MESLPEKFRQLTITIPKQDTMESTIPRGGSSTPPSSILLPTCPKSGKKINRIYVLEVLTWTIHTMKWRSEQKELLFQYQDPRFHKKDIPIRMCRGIECTNMVHSDGCGCHKASDSESKEGETFDATDECTGMYGLPFCIPCFLVLFQVELDRIRSIENTDPRIQLCKWIMDERLQKGIVSWDQLAIDTFPFEFDDDMEEWEKREDVYIWCYQLFIMLFKGMVYTE